MKTIFKKIGFALSILLLCLTFDANASHLTGGEITYTHLGGNSYRITLNVFRACSGITPGNTANVTLTSTCGGSITINAMPNTSIQQVTQVCNASINNTTCANGGIWGTQVWTYQATVTLTPPCPTGIWTARWGSCCRPGGFGNPQNIGTGSFGAVAKLVQGQQPSAPKFVTQAAQAPIQYFCISPSATNLTQVNFSFAPVAATGDSLVFITDTALSSGWNAGLQNYNPVTYNAPATALNPITGWTLNSRSGAITFNAPTVAGVYVATVRIESYDLCTGAFKGYIKRDIQFIGQNCTNLVPEDIDTAAADTVKGLYNLQGNAQLSDSNSIKLCVGQTFTVDLTYRDGDATDSIIFIDSIANVLPGATVTQIGANPATLRISWTAPPGSPPYISTRVIITDSACPFPGVTQFTFDVTVREGIYAGADVGTCDSALLPVSGATIFGWHQLHPITNQLNPVTVGPQFSCDSCANPVARPPVTTTYVVIRDTNDTFALPCTFVDYLFCDGNDTVTVFVNPDSVVQAHGDTAMCEPDTAQLWTSLKPTKCSGTNDVYSWAPTTGMVGANTANPKVFVQNTTTFTVTYTDSCGCMYQDQVTVGREAIVMDSLVVTPPTCGLANGEIEIQASGGFPPYEFSIDTGQTWQSLNKFTGLNTNFYQFLGRDTGGCTGTLDTSLVNPSAPIINAVNDTDIVCHGANDGIVDIDATGGSGNLYYSITNGSSYFPFSKFTNLTAGQYLARVRDDSNCLTLPKPAFVFEPDEIIIDSASKRDLTCFNDGTGRIIVYAHGGFGNLRYSKDNGVTYQNSPVFNSLQAGAYNVVVQDDNGCIKNQLVFLTQPQQIIPTFVVVNDRCFQAGEGEVVATATGGSGSYNYNWQGISLNNRTIPNLVAGNYDLTVTDNKGCVGSGSATVTEPLELVFKSTNKKDVSCYNFDDAELSIVADGGTTPYQFSDNNGFSFKSNGTFNNLAPGNKIVKIRDANNCEASQTVEVVQPPSVQITTSFGQKTICESTSSEVGAVASGGHGGAFSYYWTGSDGSTLGNSTVHTVTPSEATEYKVYAEDKNGCQSAEKSLEIDLYEPLAIALTTTPEAVCPGKSAQVKAEITGGTGKDYRVTWTPNVGVSNALIATPVLTPNQTTTYQVLVEDKCGSSPLNQPFEIEVKESPEVSFETTESLGCAPFTVKFTNTSPSSDRCVWNFGAEGATSEDCDATFYTFQEDGRNDISLTVWKDGCESTLFKEDFITVRPKPEANFVMSPNPTTLSNTYIQFTDQSRGGINEWDWSFAGRGESQQQNPRYDLGLDEAGVYDIVLTVRTVEGCEDEMLQELVVGEDFAVFAAKAFTPNNDRLNEVFKPQGIGIDALDYLFTVYDRWGHEIFSTDDVNTGWDGKQGGRLVPEGAYLWKMKMRDKTSEGEYRNFEGQVTVIR